MKEKDVDVFEASSLQVSKSIEEIKKDDDPLLFLNLSFFSSFLKKKDHRYINGTHTFFQNLVTFFNSPLF